MLILKNWISYMIQYRDYSDEYNLGFITQLTTYDLEFIRKTYCKIVTVNSTHKQVFFYPSNLKNVGNKKTEPKKGI